MSNRTTVNPKVKDILTLIGKGVLLSSLFLFPGAGMGIAAIYKLYEGLEKEKEFKDWSKYNLPRLRYNLKRLHQRKIIEIVEKNGISEIKLTGKGRTELLKFDLENFELKHQGKWDGKWRLVIYDISKFKKKNQELFRIMLKKLQLLQLQRSVYLTPYPCEKEIRFLKEYFDIGREVIVMRVDHLEDEREYRTYFGI